MRSESIIINKTQVLPQDIRAGLRRVWHNAFVLQTGNRDPKKSLNCPGEWSLHSLPPQGPGICVYLSISLAQGQVLLLMGRLALGLQVPGALGSLSQPLHSYLVLEQPVLVVPDAAASLLRLGDHHTARLHVLHVVWHCQEPPQGSIPEAEISPALLGRGSWVRGPWAATHPT